MAASETFRAWHELPADAAAVLRPELPRVAREIIEAIPVEIPAYARPMDGPFGRGLVVGVEEALRQFVDGIAAGGGTRRARVYGDLGRGEMRAGRSLEALLGAYRVGARVAWRRFSEACVAAQLPPETIYQLAESIFAYIDELSAKSAEGYALEQSALARERGARRQRLARLLVREPPADPIDVTEAARDAAWRLPRRLAVLAFPEDAHERIVPRLPADALVETSGEVACAIIPDPERPDRRAQLERAVGVRASAGLGPAVPWSDAALSSARARALLTLAGEDAAPARGLLDARDHTAALLLRSDRRLAQELVRVRLAPLADVPAGTRARLTETLAVWLAYQGRLQAVAERLHVHPQTVRYRLAQLRDLFGDALDDPDGRFELELALRVRADG
jgi:PucR-like helix-turn-helix protein